MFFLIISILTSAMMSIVLRLSQGRIRGKFAMLAVNYATCIIAGLFDTGAESLLRPGSGVELALGLGIVNGVLYLAALMIQQMSIEKNGITLSSVFQRIGGLLVPFLVSVVFFRERPVALQVIGAVLAIGSIVAMNRDEQSRSVGSMLLLLLLFLADGTTSSTSKIYGELGNPAFSDHFVSYTFLVALLCSMIVVLKRKERFGWAELIFGLLIGIPNFFGTKALLAALDTVPGVIAYPVRSVSSMLVVAIVGLAVFHEKLNRRQWCCIAAIVTAVVLLSFGG